MPSSRRSRPPRSPRTGADLNIRCSSDNFHPVIASFADACTEDIFNGRNAKVARRIPKDLWPVATRKLSMLDYATDLRDVATPGHNLEKLKGALASKYSIRIDDQFRIVFNFDRGEATNVVIADYHR